MAYTQQRMKRKDKVKRIEYHLKNYNQYRIAIKTLEKQLDYMLPACVASFNESEGGGTQFTISSTTENAALDRMESRRALEIKDDIERYKIIRENIDIAYKELNHLEQKYVQNRYILDQSVQETADKLGYSVEGVYKLRNKTMDQLLIMLGGTVHL